MRGLSLFVVLAVTLCAPRVCRAALIVDPPQPITRRVTVQPIQTALDDGSSPATVFGDATRRAAIEGLVDSVWAQAGIDVDFLPDVVPYDDTFAYQGNLPPTEVRPSTDLTNIITNAQHEGGILHPDSSVINTFFVHVVPAWNLKPAYWVTGNAYTGANGIAQYIGIETSPEHVAHWVAHEIGHNLGLFHTSSSSQNLMNESKRITSQLSSSQINTILLSGGSGFAQPFSGFLDGDYNHDGRVDSADYTYWRDSLGVTGFGLSADGNGDQIVDQIDYSVWQSHFGYTTGSSGGATATSILTSTPEPATAVYVVTALLVLSARLRRRHF